jgi:putative acetyltransferase
MNPGDSPSGLEWYDLRCHSMNAIHVRHAVIADAEAVVAIHHAAVHETAGPYYTPDVLEAWAVKPTTASCERVRGEISDERMIVLVAEIGRRVIGFGMAVPANKELRAIYVHPDSGRKGVGAAILGRLEELAIARNVDRLHLDASVNAEAFYARHGYEEVERTVHRLRSGQEMACIRMTKLLRRDRSV